MTSGVWIRATTWALLLGLGHALVDAASGFLIHAELPGQGYIDRPSVEQLVLLYNLIAFGTQAPLGYAADRLGAYRGAAALALLCSVGALICGPRWIVAGVVAAGIGNALYHVGAGAMVLKASGTRATESGVFVGPGAAGLYAGVWLGRRQLPGRWGIASALALCLPLVLKLGATMRAAGDEAPDRRAGQTGLVLLSALGLVGSVFMRALVGGLIGGTWRRRSALVPALLALAACGGKFAGGFVGDQLGWISTSVGALALSAPLVTVLLRRAPAAVIGALLFQVTMPVTLKASHLLFPRHPGFAFGLPCLFLALGALTLMALKGQLQTWPVGLGLMGLAVLCVTGGLLGLKRLGLLPGHKSGDTDAPGASA